MTSDVTRSPAPHSPSNARSAPSAKARSPALRRRCRAVAQHVVPLRSCRRLEIVPTKKRRIDRKEAVLFAFHLEGMTLDIQSVLSAGADPITPLSTKSARAASKDPPARIYVCVPEWTGPFDIEIDCIATV
jgi:hypothetical protein